MTKIKDIIDAINEACDLPYDDCLNIISVKEECSCSDDYYDDDCYDIYD